MRMQLRATTVPVRMVGIAAGWRWRWSSCPRSPLTRTDTMLDAPAPGDWRTWRRDGERLGRPLIRSIRAPARMVWSGGDAARL